MSLTEAAIKTLEAKMQREWEAHHNAKEDGYADDAAELLDMYNANGFRLAKLRMRLQGE